MAALSYLSATVKGGFFEQYGTTISAIAKSSSLRKRAALALGRRGGLAIRQVMRTLDGVVAGSTATKAIGRVVASSELGGVRAIESVNLVNAATVAQDITDINARVLAYTSNNTNFPANGDGNPLGIVR